jgi:hypothetical protein
LMVLCREKVHRLDPAAAPLAQELARMDRVPSAPVLEVSAGCLGTMGQLCVCVHTHTVTTRGRRRGSVGVYV